MQNVVNIFDREKLTNEALERLHAMNIRSKQQFAEATQEAETLISKLQVLQHGHYALITEGGSQKVVIIYTDKKQLVNGSFLVSRFCETDQPPFHMRYLTKDHNAQDLGDYVTFKQANQAIWNLALKSPHSPRSGLAMVRAVHHLVSRGTAVEESAVNEALEAYGKQQQPAVFDIAEQRLNEKLLSHI